MNEIDLLPEEISEDAESHINDHNIIHAGLKDHETRMTQAESAIDTKSDTNHEHDAADITTGTLDVERIPTGQTETTVAIGNDSRFTDARTPKAHTHDTADITNLDVTLETKADASHQHPAEDIISGTINVQRLPVGTTSGTVASGNDSRFTDARTPKTHTHNISDITTLQATLDTKADLVSGQIPTSQIPAIALTKPFAVVDRAAMLALDAQEGDIAIITGENEDRGSYVLGSGPSDSFSSWMMLAVSSDASVQSVNGQTGTIVLSASDIGAAPENHSHTIAQITNLQTTLNQKADADHTHSISNIDGLEAELDGKAASSHTHAWSTITSKPTTFTPESHTHTVDEISDSGAAGQSILRAADYAEARNLLGTPSSSEVEEAIEGVEEWVQSRGTNLITNGTGSFGDNTNFTGSVFDSTDAPPGIRGSFVPPAHSGSLYAGEALPVNPANRYVVKYWARQRIEGATNLGRHYSLLSPIDAYGHAISPFHYCYQPGTTTALAADLSPGDTYVSLVSAANWYNGSENHRRTLTFWNYVDQGGKAWGVETYTRNYYGSIYAAGGLDYTNNRVNLIEPWSGPLITAGTPLSNGQSGGNYIYPVTSFVPEEWTEYGGYVAAATNYTGQPSTSDTGWPPGTGMAQLGFLTNYQAASGVSEHAFAGIEFASIPDPESLADGSIPESKLRAPTAIGSGANLNNYTATGKYHQGSDAAAQSGTNYPVDHAGYLEVVSSADGAMTYQMYRTYGSLNKVYVRSWYGYSSFWGSWKELSEVGHNHSVGDLTASGTRSSSTYLRGDGTWATPPNTNTTYSAMSQAEATSTSSTTARLATGQRLHQAISSRIQLVSTFPSSPTTGVLYLKAY